MAIEHVYTVDDVIIAIQKSNPPQFYIRARGTVRTSGWRNPLLVPRVYVRPPEDGIWDFDFLAEAPTGIVLQVITSIYADTTWDSSNGLSEVKGIRVHAESGFIEKVISDIKEYPTAEARGGNKVTMAGGGAVFPW